MALVLTTAVLPPIVPYGSPLTRVVHSPTQSATTFPTPSIAPFHKSGVASPASLSATTVDVLLILAIIVALSGTCVIVWLCFRQRTRMPTRPSEQAPQKDPEIATSTPKIMQETHIVPNTWDSSHAFWVKRVMHIPDPITTTQTRMNEGLLSEVPKVWRILGRPNVATEDSEPEYDEAISDRRKTAT
ncbi:hypothetical protein DFH08DRAFT_425362 [Mycena albidolilacea]|uniref:Uncharacterized protein n=1 Tax=Mycena albidolilacea TaxID=1033008 RepID=A0AAD6ZBI9_9AGAR|nr:hypothetical protein DFH08DRAFT_425362 [Mycena albidolilacea]